MTSTILVENVVVLRVQGRVEGRDLTPWVEALEVAGFRGRGPVLADLAALEAWSIAAQAAVINAAQRVGAQGREFAVCRPQPRLRDCGPSLRVFERLTCYGDLRSAERALGLPTGALDLAVAQRRATAWPGRPAVAPA